MTVSQSAALPRRSTLVSSAPLAAIKAKAKAEATQVKVNKDYIGSPGGYLRRSEV